MNKLKLPMSREGKIGLAGFVERLSFLGEALYKAN